jgi:hypothetical protein
MVQRHPYGARRFMSHAPRSRRRQTLLQPAPGRPTQDLQAIHESRTTQQTTPNPAAASPRPANARLTDGSISRNDCPGSAGSAVRDRWITQSTSRGWPGQATPPTRSGSCAMRTRAPASPSVGSSGQTSLARRTGGRLRPPNVAIARGLSAAATAGPGPRRGCPAPRPVPSLARLQRRRLAAGPAGVGHHGDPARQDGGEVDGAGDDGDLADGGGRRVGDRSRHERAAAEVGEQLGGLRAEAAAGSGREDRGARARRSCRCHGAPTGAAALAGVRHGGAGAACRCRYLYE